MLTIRSSFLARFLNRLPFILLWVAKRLAGQETPWPGWILPQKIVVKTITTNDELLAYHRLYPLQGKVIPRCYGRVQFEMELLRQDDESGDEMNPQDEEIDEFILRDEPTLGKGIVLEWIRGESIMDWVERMPAQKASGMQDKVDKQQLSKAECDWVKTVYSMTREAVLELSRHQMVHGDLEFWNIMVETDMTRLTPTRVILIDLETVIIDTRSAIAYAKMKERLDKIKFITHDVIKKQNMIDIERRFGRVFGLEDHMKPVG